MYSSNTHTVTDFLSQLNSQCQSRSRAMRGIISPITRRQGREKPAATAPLLSSSLRGQRHLDLTSAFTLICIYYIILRHDGIINAYTLLHHYVSFYIVVYIDMLRAFISKRDRFSKRWLSQWETGRSSQVQVPRSLIWGIQRDLHNYQGSLILNCYVSCAYREEKRSANFPEAKNVRKFRVI